MRISLCCLISLTFSLLGCVQVRADTLPVTFTVSDRPLQQQITAFAQVTPQHLYQVTSSLAGRVANFSIKPGESVRRGESIADLTGAGVTEQAQVAADAVKQAQVDVASANTLLKLVQQQQRQTLATRQDVLKARSSLSEAKARLEIAESRQQALISETRLLSPASGKVISVAATDGDYVSAGQSLLKILPTNELWLSARIFGQDGQQLQPGLPGVFHPNLGGEAIPVSVATTAPGSGAGGTWQVYLLPKIQSPAWFAGEAGKLVLHGPAFELPAIPSAALIMDQGKWWVMVASEQGERPVHVVPASSRHGWTWLKQGLSVGQKVLVRNAYQRFHQNFARQYANPD